MHQHEKQTLFLWKVQEWGQSSFQNQVNVFQDSDFDVFLKNLLFLTDTFLLHANGIIDANGDDITNKDIMAHALANLGGPDSAQKL